jgi:alpha-D-ribose 1-methylphosphonate 5-phosphate C-P lyase
VPYRIEDQRGVQCYRTGATNKFMNELPQDDGSSLFELSDSGYGEKLLRRAEGETVHFGDTYFDNEGRFYHDGVLRD